MINSATLIDEVKTRFPGFVISEEMDALPTVIFSFLADQLVSAITNKDDTTKETFIQFIDEMAVSDDRVLVASLSEIVAVLYDNLDQALYSGFVKLLSSTAQNKFDINVRLWNSQFPQSDTPK